LKEERREEVERVCFPEEALATTGSPTLLQPITRSNPDPILHPAPATHHCFFHLIGKAAEGRWRRELWWCYVGTTKPDSNTQFSSFPPTSTGKSPTGKPALEVYGELLASKLVILMVEFPSCGLTAQRPHARLGSPFPQGGCIGPRRGVGT
jgi:hypothetical protein